jgi:hypothetical protein
MNALLTPPRDSCGADPLSPLRLSQGGGTDYERQLLASAGHDRAPAATAARRAALLSAARESRPDLLRDDGPGAGRAASGGQGALRGWKPWAAGVVGMGVVVAIVASRWPAGSVPFESAPASTSMTASPAVGVGALGVARERENVKSSSAVAGSAESDAPAAVVAAVQPRRSEASRRATVPQRSAVSTIDRPPLTRSALADEVRAIESIQTLLGWGQAQQAASALTEYRRRFPRGELALEADLLDVDIALASGERGRATELARALVQRPAAGRYRSRLSQLLQGGSVSKREPFRGSGSQPESEVVESGSNGAAAQMKERR